MKILLNTDYNISGSEEERNFERCNKMLSVGSVNILISLEVKFRDEAINIKK
jgi:hypothetical protein